MLHQILASYETMPARLSVNKHAEEGRFAMADKANLLENISKEDLSTNDADYAELPDLSELEKMIDWEDINEREESPAKPNQNYNDTQELDINRI